MVFHSGKKLLPFNLIGFSKATVSGEGLLLNVLSDHSADVVGDSFISCGVMLDNETWPC